MSTSDVFTDPVLINWHVNPVSGQKYSIERLNEQYQVVQGKIVLNEVPDYQSKVQIDGMVEIQGGTPSVNKYRVHYGLGVINFDPSREGQTITIKRYFGRGVISYPASRMYTINKEGLFNSGTVEDALNEVYVKTKGVENRVENIIADGGSSTAEVVDARMGVDGVAYPVLRDRLNSVDTKFNNVNAQLAQTEQQIEKRFVNVFSSKSYLAEPVAHRGLLNYAPENTIPAFEAAKRIGFRFIECDVSELANGEEIYIFHDTNADRMTDGTGEFIWMTKVQANALVIDAGNNLALYPGLKVPTFDEFLSMCARLNLKPIIHIYSVQNEAIWIQKIRKYGLEEHVIIASFNNAHLTRFRAVSDKVQLMTMQDPNLQSTIDFCLVTKNCGIFCSGGQWNATSVANAKNAGLLTGSWTINTSQMMLQHTEWGINFIVGDLTFNLGGEKS